MNKPMYCPMSFNGCEFTQITPKKCTPDCAWAVIDKEKYRCGVVHTDANVEINMRSLENKK